MKKLLITLALLAPMAAQADYREVPLIAVPQSISDCLLHDEAFESTCKNYLRLRTRVESWERAPNPNAMTNEGIRNFRPMVNEMESRLVNHNRDIAQRQQQAAEWRKAMQAR